MKYLPILWRFSGRSFGQKIHRDDTKENSRYPFTALRDAGEFQGTDRKYTYQKWGLTNQTIPVDIIQVGWMYITT